MDIRVAVLLGIDLAQQNRIGRITHIDNVQAAAAFAPKITDAIYDHHVLKSPAFRRIVITGHLRICWVGNINDHYAGTVVRSQVRVMAFAPDVAVTVIAVEGIKPSEKFQRDLRSNSRDEED